MTRNRNIVATEPLLPIKQDVQRSGRDPYPTLDLVTDDPIFAKEAVDGRPWSKTCEECAFKDSWQRKDYLQIAAQTDTDFYCVHREDCDENRVCAGYAAYEKARGR